MNAHTEIEQGSAEWLAIRLGKVTASRMSDVMAKGKGGAASATRATYMGEIVAERLSGQPLDSFKSAAMDHGTESEPSARLAYEWHTQSDVALIGFVQHPNIAMAGASPDGLVGTDGMVEIKCPNTATHLKYLFGGTIPKAYQDQMQWGMACTGRKWCDFVSYDPRLPPARGQFYRERIARNEAYIAEMEAEVAAFLAEADAMIAKIDGLFGYAPDADDPARLMAGG